MNLKFETLLPVSAAQVYEWHANPGAFERLQPPWENVKILSFPERLEDGAVAEFLIKNGPLRVKWEALHSEVKPNHGFRDTQRKGPFKSWEHEHTFEESGKGQSLLIDSINYVLPGGGLGNILAGSVVKNKIQQMFNYRHRKTKEDMKQYGDHRQGKGKTILITGRSGLIGHELEVLLITLGYTVRGLTRHPKRDSDFHWDPANGKMNTDALKGVDAVIHLAGESIAEGRWNEERKRRIMESRVKGTRLLVDTMETLTEGPDVFICASGINYYGNGDPLKGEEMPKGEGFLADVCDAWEAEAMKAKNETRRVVIIRTGIVLTPKGGALEKMLIPFRAGLGGPIGSGSQKMSWIGIDDLLDIYVAAIEEREIRGPINAVVPEPIAQKDFAKTLGKVLGRPAILPLPEFAVRTALGQMGEETLLINLPVVPSELQNRKFEYRHPDLEDYLRYILGKT